MGEEGRARKYLCRKYPKKRTVLLALTNHFSTLPPLGNINLMSKEGGYWKRGYKRAKKKKKLENENDDAEGMEKNDFQYINDDIRSCIKFLREQYFIVEK